MIGGLGARARTALLVLSILLNAALLGLVASRWGPAAKHRDAKTEASLTLDRYFASLPEPARSRFSDAFERERAEIMPPLTRLLEARIRLANALRAPSFDKAETEAALAELREANFLAQGPLHRVLMAAVEDLSPEERLRLLHLDYGFSREWRRNFGLDDEPRGQNPSAAPQDGAKPH
ncbi:MAG: periplasmic heavy metal sensor [Alphaproteobacteria bacterium]|nr:periplasmic heavy metal sensor [Alphaproteobacteria bacterium]